MNASLHRVKKISLGQVEPLRDGDGAESYIMGYTRDIMIDYEDDAILDLTCHADKPNDLYLAGYNPHEEAPE